MKALQLILVLVVLSLNLAALGGTPTDRLRDASQNLNEAIRKADLNSLAPDLAGVLDVEADVLKKAMVDQKLKLSDVALAKLLSKETEKSIDSFLKTGSEAEWLERLQTDKVPVEKAEEYLDELHAEVAFLMLDHREKKR